MKKQMMGRWPALVLVFLALMLQGSTCKESDFVFSGNIDSISDVALAKCDTYADKKFKNHTCMLLTNPFRKSVRVFDVTDNQFVLSPINYFPLAIEVGQIPLRIASLPQSDLGKVFVLDTGINQIFPVTTKYEGKTPSFISPKAEDGIQVDAGSEHIAVTKSGDQIWTLSAASDSQKVQMIQIDPKTGKKLAAKDFPLGNGAPTTIKVLAVDSDSQFLIVGGVGGAKLMAFDLNSILASSSGSGNSYFLSVNPGDGDVFRVAIGKIKVKQANNESEKTLLLALMKNSKKAVLYDLTAKTRLGEVTLSGLPLAGYIPQGERQNCCNNSPDAWAAVLTASGELQYINLQAVIDNKKDDKGNEAKIGATIVVADKAGVLASKTANAIAILGTTSKNDDEKISQRKMFLVYSNLILSLNEGDTTPVKRIDGR